MKLAIIDTLGLTYDGSTLNKRGLGGSESAVILIAKELADVGFNVTVFNDCISDDSKPGIYDGVTYAPLKDVEVNNQFDIMIGSRSVASFAPIELIQRFKSFTPLPDFTAIHQNSKWKVLWMHDTFCDGDDLIEDFILHGRINEIFTLSDFHTSYVSNCDHGKRRNFEVLKNHIFQTRNGIKKHIDWVDVREKNPNQFIYNASVTKGMIPLVEKVWPKIKQQIPDAELTVIGGYYRFRSDHQPDEQEQRWHEMVRNHGKDIEFTGIITQKEIADRLANASFMLYPAAFPETFGISTLESLAYNTPLITCQFGALEETAIDAASYKIPYAIEPNGLFPWINTDAQVDRFVELTLFAYHNKYLHQQKMYACNQIKDICGWDTVALQWKQHFFKVLGAFLPIGDYRKVSKINHDVRKVFGRKFYNLDEIQEPRQEQKNIMVITPVYNAEKYIRNCMLSVAQQDYDNYTMYIIDDASTDNTVAVIYDTLLEFESISGKVDFRVIENKTNEGAVRNQVCTIAADSYNYSDSIVMLLDGDDWLINDPNIFHKYNNLYADGAEFTYGSCWSLVDNIPLIAQPYPPEVKANKSYRDYKFNWNMPYTHLRTFKKELFNRLDHSVFQDENGNWLRAGGDTAVFYNILEQADPNKVVCIPDIVCNYNDMNPLNDYKVNGTEQTKTANSIINKNKPKQKFSVIVPTMWRCKEIFARSIQSYIDNDLVDEIIIIDNDKKETPNWSGLDHPKIKMHTQESNIMVNPAWNLGVSLSKNNLVAIINDDIIFDPKLFEKIEDKLTPEAGVFGIITGEAIFNHPLTTDGSIDFIEWKPGDNIHGFGQAMFIHKDNWVTIIDGLSIYYGDDFIFHSNLINNRKNYLIYNINFESPMASTTKDTNITLNHFEKDQAIWVQYINGIESKKKFSVIVPTMWRCLDLFERSLHKLVEHPLVDEVIIIDNDKDRTPIHWEVFNDLKIKIITTSENIGVNPAWNLGVEFSKNDLLCIVNDDIVFDSKLFDVIEPLMQQSDTGALGIINGDPIMGQPVKTDGSINFLEWQPGMIIHCFGQLMFTHKKNWVTIPNELVINYGDDVIFHWPLMNGKKNYLIYNIDFETRVSSTVTDPTVTLVSPERFERERQFFGEWSDRNPILKKKIEPMKIKDILIAIPCKNDIEADTFKSIYDLIVPEGYKVHFQYFYGYAVDQVRNLIADWVIKGYDYLFAVDHDMIFECDTLLKLLAADKPIVSGVYRQRLEQQTIEIYDHTLRHMPFENLLGRDLIEVGGCGFGCVLVKKEVFADVGYPQFVYHQALDHSNTFSEDLDFCNKARSKGHTIWCDTSVICGHIGQKVFLPQIPIMTSDKIGSSPEQNRFRQLKAMNLFPQEHVDYLNKMKNNQNLDFKVIYDIGACVLHWTDQAKKVWTGAEFIAFEAMDATKFLYEEAGIKYHLGPLGDKDNTIIDFYENVEHPGGNSIYKENIEFSTAADILFPEEKKVRKILMTLDTIVKERNFPAPDLIKMDVQGAEMDILKGAQNTLKNCRHLILELQSVDYNRGAPKVEEVKEYLLSLGYKDVSGMFSGGSIDGDYHFYRD